LVLVKNVKPEQEGVPAAEPAAAASV
ncbi:MAG: hypothetical protein QOI71_3617, partial [Gaiellales bacterium]|nr:hypothetical protein [Gaiellales bacterium]